MGIPGGEEKEEEAESTFKEIMGHLPESGKRNGHPYR